MRYGGRPRAGQLVEQGRNVTAADEDSDGGERKEEEGDQLGQKADRHVYR